MSYEDSIEPAELITDQILTIADDRFQPDTVAIVTGAGSGVGRATTLALAGNGLSVAAGDIDEEGLAETVELATEMDLAGEVYEIPTDLSSDESCEHLVEAAAEKGAVRYLANIAGIQHVESIEEFPMAKYDQVQSIMLRAPLLLTKLCLPQMREVGTGAIGNMCSVHGHVATRDKVAYIMTKFGLRGLTQATAAEGGGEVRAFTVSTGYVKTPLVTNQIEDSARERGISPREVIEDVMVGPSRVKEMMDPVDVANLFVLGFSKHARHLDGGDLLWDGGMTLTYE